MDGDRKCCRDLVNVVRKYPTKYQGLLIRQLSPVPTEPLSKILKHVDHVIVAEYNARGQIRTLIKEALDNKNVYSLFHYDGEHLTDEQFELAVHEIADGMSTQIV